MAIQNNIFFLSYFTLPNIIHILKTLSCLFLFAIVSPIPIIITFITLIIHLFTRKPQINNPNAKRILISGGGMTKSLQLARLFYSAGHYVVLTEEYSYTSHRYSRCVSRFYLCADTDNHSEYIQSIVDIVKKEHIDVFVPVSHSSNERIDALLKQALLPLNCETIHGNIDQVTMLSDKYEFIEKARSLGLTIPKTYKITDPNQILKFDFSKDKCQYILKSINYNTIARANLLKFPCKTEQQMIDYVNSLIINEKHPWIMQEFITGKEYCTHGTVRNGHLTVYACCQSSSWLLNYKHIDSKDNILKWVEDFCLRANINGQASFDFIESNDNGQIYALECNPRTHTAITTFYNQTSVADAYLNKQGYLNGPIQPKSNAKEIYWLYHELWNLFKIKTRNDLIKQLKRFYYGKEAIYSIDDPFPFFHHYTIHMPRIIIYNLLHMKYFNKIDCNLGLLL